MKNPVKDTKEDCPLTPPLQVFRGGSWDDLRWPFLSDRSPESPFIRDIGIGFRLARTIKKGKR